MQIMAARIVLAVLSATLLTACAGGGGGGGGGVAVAPPISPVPPSPPPPPPPPPPLPAPGSIPDPTSAEYTAGYAVADTQAISAWRAGATGQGVLVGVIDDGVDSTHPELAGRISPASIDINTSRNTLFDRNFTHGSELSSIIAGNFNNSQTLGLAYNATVLAIRADNGADGFASSDLAGAVDYAIAQNARIINFSLGSSSPSSTTFQSAIQRATAAGIIVVVSAGNDGPNAPEVNFPGFLATNPTISNNLIVVAGAHDRAGVIANFSNRAGQAQNFYLTGPGNEIIVPDFGNPGGPAGFQVCPPVGGPPTTCNVQGTSYSAPYVTGAAALILGAFPGMTPQQIVQLLLRSTDDAGVPGTDAVYGRGRLNIARAFQPVGTVAAPLSTGGVVTPMTHLGVTGAAFGDAFANSAAAGQWRTVGFDDFGRTFTMDLGRNWSRAGRAQAFDGAPALWRAEDVSYGRLRYSQESQSLPESLRIGPALQNESAAAFLLETQFSADTRVAVGARAPLQSSFLSGAQQGLGAFAGHDLSAAVIHELGNGNELALTTQSGSSDLGAFGRSTRRLTSLRLSRLSGATGIALSAGALNESSASLGLSWRDGLGAQPGGDTRYLGLEALWRPAPGLSLAAGGEWGQARLTDDGWLKIKTPLVTSAYALTAALAAPQSWAGQDGRGRLTLSLRQPLRVDSGAFSVLLPTANEFGRSSLGYETRVIRATPSGRELTLSAGYEIFFDDWLSAQAGVSWTREPGHVRDATPESSARVGLRLSF